jgi:hypothetical protein
MMEIFAFPKLEENEVQIFRPGEIPSAYKNVFRIMLNEMCCAASDLRDALAFGFRDHHIQWP